MIVMHNNFLLQLMIFVEKYRLRFKIIVNNNSLMQN